MSNQSLKIQEQIKKLIAMGYYSFQVHQFICDYVGTGEINQLSPADMEKLILGLDNQIKFGLKCQM